MLYQLLNKLSIPVIETLLDYQSIHEPHWYMQVYVQLCVYMGYMCVYLGICVYVSMYMCVCMYSMYIFGYKYICIYLMPPISKDCSNTFLDRSFIYAAPCEWNKLSECIRTSSFDSFRKSVKTMLFTQQYG